MRRILILFLGFYLLLSFACKKQKTDQPETTTEQDTENSAENIEGESFSGETPLEQFTMTHEMICLLNLPKETVLYGDDFKTQTGVIPSDTDFVLTRSEIKGDSVWFNALDTTGQTGWLELPANPVPAEKIYGQEILDAVAESYLPDDSDTWANTLAREYTLCKKGLAERRGPALFIKTGRKKIIQVDVLDGKGPFYKLHDIIADRYIVLYLQLLEGRVFHMIDTQSGKEITLSSAPRFLSDNTELLAAGSHNEDSLDLSFYKLTASGPEPIFEEKLPVSAAVFRFDSIKKEANGDIAVSLMNHTDEFRLDFKVIRMGESMELVCPPQISPDRQYLILINSFEDSLFVYTGTAMDWDLPRETWKVENVSESGNWTLEWLSDDLCKLTLKNGGNARSAVFSAGKEEWSVSMEDLPVTRISD